MKTFIFTLFFACLSALSYAQFETALFNTLSEEVAQNETRPKGFKEDAVYTLLDVNTVNWENILESHPHDLTLTIPYGDLELELNLHEVNFFRDDFTVRTASGERMVWNEVSRSIYYNGSFEGVPNSHFALSVLNNEIIGVGSISGIGDVNLGKLLDREYYVFYSENGLEEDNDFICKTNDDDILTEKPDGYVPPEDDGPIIAPKALGDCVGLYFEVDYDIFTDKGSVVAATDYITALFNEIYLLYDADAMTVYLSDVLVWDAPSPYGGVTDTPTLLNLFGTTTPVWLGDLGHFVSYRGNGGLAWLDVFCHPDQALRKAVSDIDATFEAIPVFSWTIEVVAHEMGHNFGSPHTHACFWNGTLTAIDGCGPTAGYDEGCTEALPASGTIMSYCHLVGGVGIDLGLGFGLQPGDHIRNEIIDATCLDGCDLNPFMDVEVTDLVLTSTTCEGDSTFAEIHLLNNGNEDLTTLDIDVLLDGVLEEEITWTGVIVEDGTGVIEITGMLLPVGTYTLSVVIENPNGVEDAVTDNNEFEITFTITEYPEVTITAFEDISCFGADDGSIDVTVTGGSPGYSYDWDNGAGVVEDPADLGANTYTLIVTDTEGCAVEVSQELTEPTEIVVTADVTENPDCFADATGVAEVSATGGSPGYSYAWSSGGGGTTETGLASGDYTVTVTDDNGCEVEETITVVSPPEIEVTSDITQAGCGMDNGGVTISTAGGVPGYSYAWSTGDGTADLDAVGTGTYSLTVTDDNGCEVDMDFFVPEDPAPELVLDVIEHVDCFGDETGSIVVSSTDVSGVAEYEWSTGDSGFELTGVGAGEYTVVLMDDSNCSDEETFTITSSVEIIIEPTIDGISCNGLEDGNVFVTVSGGTPGYDYSWSTGAITAGIEDLGAGSYEITITDLIGCTETLEVDMVEPDTIGIEMTSDDEYCDNENGFVEITVSGGTPGYSYAWSTGATTASLEDVPAGIYNVLVTDANGCTNAEGVILENIDDFEAEVSKEDNMCFGEFEGTGTVTVISGESPYTYEWSDGQTTPTAVGLAGGDYTVLVTAANGCQEEFEITVEEPSEIVAASSVSNEVFGGDGQITVTVSGGVEPYTYSWDTGETTDDLFDLEAGTYTLTVTDANGCTAVFVYVVDSQLGIEDVADNTLVIYPNPASDELRIANPSGVQINGIKLYNSIGQIVLDEVPTGNDPVVYLSDIASGMYYVVLNVEGKLVKTQLLVQH